MDIQVSKIMRGIVRKKGLYGTIAKKYLNDEKLARQFIIECSEQTHNISTRQHWGEKLTREIEKFCRTN